MESGSAIGLKSIRSSTVLCQGWRIYEAHVKTAHECFVPSRSGYHVILAVWDVGDTSSSFYNAIDVNFDSGPSAFGGSGTTPDVPNPVDTNPSSNDAYVDIGNIEASMDLDSADIVRLRLFSIKGEQFGREYEVAVGNVSNGVRNDWPVALARHVNAQGGDVIVGVSQSGNGESARPTTGRNDVFARPSSGVVRTEIEFVLSGTPTPPGPDGNSTTDVGAYPDGLGAYQVGDSVAGLDGNQYECIVAGWCNIAPSYYGPGTGSDWQDAWRFTIGGVPETSSDPIMAAILTCLFILTGGAAIQQVLWCRATVELLTDVRSQVGAIVRVSCTTHRVPVLHFLRHGLNCRFIRTSNWGAR